jgi:hypothetical protein
MNYLISIIMNPGVIAAELLGGAAAGEAAGGLAAGTLGKEAVGAMAKNAAGTMGKNTALGMGKLLLKKLRNAGATGKYVTTGDDSTVDDPLAEYFDKLKQIEQDTIGNTNDINDLSDEENTAQMDKNRELAKNISKTELGT